ncbi:MAG: Holliday junction resolvase-like protein [Gemmatimonadota bacterium]
MAFSNHPEALVGLLLGGLAGAVLSILYFLIWRGRYLRRIRVESVQRSQAVIAGKVYEQMLPYFPGFPFNPKDARFLGSPVDLVVFDGLDRGQLERVVFVEVKTGGSGLSNRERQLKAIVQARRVEWIEIRK